MGKKKPKTSTRKPGPPKKTAPVVNQEVMKRIGTMHLKGKKNTEIAAAIGIDESTVRHHLNTNIKPQWQEDMRSRLHEDMAKVDLLERTAWERFESTAPGETVEQIEKALLEGGNKLRIIKQATRKVTKTGEQGWLQIIQWCIDFRARIHAHYAPTRTHVDIGGELRVAGQSPQQVDQAMLTRLHEQILERRKHQAALVQGQMEGRGESQAERN